MRPLLFAVRACAAGLVGTVLFLTTIAACSSGGSSPCENAGATACAKACSCGSGQCNMVLPATLTTQASFLTFDTSADCTAEYQIVCANSPKVATVDFGACQSGLDAAACAPDPAGASSKQGVALPPTCSALW